MSWRELLARAAAGVGAADAAAALVQFVELFERWNQRINLSAARSHDDIAQHVIDSLALMGHLGEASSAIDVGSGGGFPLIVLGACRSELTWRGVEPIHKKTAFLSAAVRELGLRNVEIVTRRVDPAIDHGFDIATSRATFALDEWLALGQQLVRPGGRVLGMEARERVALGASDERHPYDAGDRQRAIIVRRVS